jgi:hypothetical protein
MMENTQKVKVGDTVRVFDRYHFAVPLLGQVEDVAAKDGAYKVILYPKQHGYPNYMKMDHHYFAKEQCRLVQNKGLPEFTNIEIVRKGSFDMPLIKICVIVTAAMVFMAAGAFLTAILSGSPPWACIFTFCCTLQTVLCFALCLFIYKTWEI